MSCSTVRLQCLVLFVVSSGGSWAGRRRVPKTEPQNWPFLTGSTPPYGQRFRGPAWGEGSNPPHGQRFSGYVEVVLTYLQALLRLY